MQNHHFSWENPLFQWPFSIAMWLFTRGYLSVPSVSHTTCHGTFHKASAQRQSGASMAGSDPCDGATVMGPQSGAQQIKEIPTK